VGWGAGEAGGIDGEGEIEGKRRWGGGRESGRLTGEGEWRVGFRSGGRAGGVLGLADRLGVVGGGA
jgi:hypothetical protein